MSKFRNILDAAKQREPEHEPPADPPRATAGARTDPPPQLPPAPAAPPAPPSPAPVATPPPTKRGRPPGKKSDPSFVQVSAYIPADLHHNVKLALLQERQGREFSELVAELLDGWLKSRG